MADYLQHHGIIGMKWGVRRYQNKDGSLTSAGEKRYARDIRENKAKKKENRIDTSEPDPNRWVKEDLNRRKNIVDTSANLVNQTKRALDEKPTKVRPDLSKMTDADLRNAINRELLERQYTDLFGKPATVEKGRQSVLNALEVGGSVLGVAGSALGIAVAIKELKG